MAHIAGCSVMGGFPVKSRCILVIVSFDETLDPKFLLMALAGPGMAAATQWCVTVWVDKWENIVQHFGLLGLPYESQVTSKQQVSHYKCQTTVGDYYSSLEW